MPKFTVGTLEVTVDQWGVEIVRPFPGENEAVRMSREEAVGLIHGLLPALGAEPKVSSK